MGAAKIKKVAIPLTDEQRELVRRRLGVDVSEWEVDSTLPPSEVGHLGTLPDQPRGDAVFLTDEQRTIIRRRTGREADYIQIETRPLLKYGGPPRDDRP
jgi:hypothetical protein